MDLNGRDDRAAQTLARYGAIWAKQEDKERKGRGKSTFDDIKAFREKRELLDVLERQAERERRDLNWEQTLRGNSCTKDGRETRVLRLGGRFSSFYTEVTIKRRSFSERILSPQQLPSLADDSQDIQPPNETLLDPAAAFEFSAKLQGKEREAVNRRLQAAIQQRMLAAISPKPCVVVGQGVDIIPVSWTEAEAVNGAVIREGFQTLQIGDTDERRLGLARAPGKYRPLMGTTLHPTVREQALGWASGHGDTLIHDSIQEHEGEDGVSQDPEIQLPQLQQQQMLQQQQQQDIDVDPRRSIAVEPLLLAFNGADAHSTRTFVVVNLSRFSVDVSFTACLSCFATTPPPIHVDLPVVSRTLGPFGEAHETITVIPERSAINKVVSFELRVHVGSRCSPDTYGSRGDDIVGRIPCVVVGRVPVAAVAPKLLAPPVPPQPRTKSEFGTILGRVSTLMFCRELAHQMIDTSITNPVPARVEGRRAILTFFEKTNTASDGWPAFASGCQVFLYPPQAVPSALAEKALLHVARRASPGWAWSLDNLVDSCTKRFGWCSTPGKVFAWQLLMALAAKDSLTPKPPTPSPLVTATPVPPLTTEDIIEAAIKAEASALASFLWGQEQHGINRSMTRDRTGRSSTLRLDQRPGKDSMRVSIEPLVQHHVKRLRDWAGFAEADQPLETSEDVALLEALPPPEDPRPIFNPPIPQFEKFRPVVGLVLSLTPTGNVPPQFPTMSLEEIIALDKQKRKPHGKTTQKTKAQPHADSNLQQPQKSMSVDFDPFTARVVGRVEVWKEAVGAWVGRLGLWFGEAEAFGREQRALSSLFNRLERREISLSSEVATSNLGLEESGKEEGEGGATTGMHTGEVDGTISTGTINSNNENNTGDSGLAEIGEQREEEEA